jgi:hypothetical protein
MDEEMLLVSVRFQLFFEDRADPPRLLTITGEVWQEFVACTR